MVGDYMLHLRRKGYTAATRRTYLGVLRSFLASFDPQTARTSAIEAWLDVRHLVPASRIAYRSALCGFYEWMMATGQIDHNPAEALVRPKVPRRLPRPIHTPELCVAIDRAPARMRLWLCLAAYGGLRCMEIANLRVDDLHLDVDPQVVHLRSTKGQKDRVVPLSDEVVKALKHYSPPAHGFLFPAWGHHGAPVHPVTAVYVSNQISRYLNEQGIISSAHRLRHWFGTEMFRVTLNIKLVSELMGHADIRTTSLYCALIPSAEAVEAVRTLRAVPADDATKGESTSATGEDQPSPILAYPYRVGRDGQWVTQEAEDAMAASVPWAAAASPGVTEGEAVS